MKKLVQIFTVMVMVLTFSASVFADGFVWEDAVSKPTKFKKTVYWVSPRSGDLENGFSTQCALSYDFWSFLAIGVEGGYTRLNVKSGGVDYGTFNSFPVLGDVILKAPYEFGDGDYKVTPYLVNGFGALINTFDAGGYFNDRGIDVDAKTGFLYKLGGGLDFYFMDWLGLNFEVSYQWSDADMSASSGSLYSEGKQDMDAFYLGGGLILRF